MITNNPSRDESIPLDHAENTESVSGVVEAIENPAEPQQPIESTEIALTGNKELTDPTSFDIKDIADESQRELIHQGYRATLANLADSIDAFRRQINANEGLFDEMSENIFNRYAFEIEESLSRGDQTDISFVTGLAENIYETINALDVDSRTGLPTPEVLNGLIQAYGELDESLHSVQLFLNDLNTQIKHPVTEQAIDVLHSLRSVIEGKSEALARIRYLSEEYHG